MRIAFVAPFGLRAKGTTRARALPLARALAARGETVALFIPPYDSPQDAGQCGYDSGVEVVNAVLPRVRVFSSASYFLLGWRVFAAVCDWRPDVVHIFKPKGPSGLVGVAFWLKRHWARAAGRSVGATRLPSTPRIVMDSDDWEGPGGWNDDPRIHYPPAQKRFFAWQERYGLSHADAWTVTSECLRDRAVAFGASADRVWVLHNGISDVGMPRVDRSVATACPPASAVLYTRFAGVRPEAVVEIWRKVRGRAPAARLTVVGRGVGGEGAVLAGAPGIELAGWVEPERLGACLAGMSVAIVPWGDTPANQARHSAKVLELMAAGLPIVAYAVGELPATLGDAAILVTPGDTDAFAAAVAQLLADPVRGRQLGAAARARVQARFTWAHLAHVATAAYAAAGEKI